MGKETGASAVSKKNFGVVAQQAERLNGIQEVVGSKPTGSTNFVLMVMGYMNEKQLIADGRASWLAGKCCCKCGSTDSLKIEYPHPNLGQRVWCWFSEARRKAELAPAKVWCAEHYHERMRARRFKDKPITHGTDRGYARGCRCDPCKAARHAYQKKWRDGVEKEAKRFHGRFM